MRGNNIPVNGPILLEKVAEKDINVSDKKNLYILLLLSLYNTLHREDKSPAYFFFKFDRNNMNSYNSKTHVIRTNFESL